MERRKFLQAVGQLSAAGFFTSSLPVMAGPFSRGEFPNASFPEDKKLNPEWVKSLYERGIVSNYTKSKNELRYIGMPVGGICCGSVYLGGDGRLWLWDIFNQNQFGVITKVLPVKLASFNLNEINNMAGALYLEPLTHVSPLQQGFALSIKHNGTTSIKRLHQDDWDEVTFEATYPVASITYAAKNLPLEVTLKAFSPFIPGNDKDSGLPATVQSISIKNGSKNPIEVEVIGWLENKMLVNTEKVRKDFIRVNKSVENNMHNGISLHCTSDQKELEKAPDYGDMFFAILGGKGVCIDDVMTSENKAAAIFKNFVVPSENSPVAGIIRTHRLKAGEEVNSDFVISWYTPNLSFYSNGNSQGMTVQDADFHYYTSHFDNSEAVATYLATNYQTLKHQTLLWKDTFYDSTLPWWFLERTFMNISTLATTTTHRFKSGRFYAWEGVGCCHGNCTHVYQYAQAMSRIFPELERDTRERVDLGIGFDEKTGMISIRGEKTGPSIDGQSGTVLRIYREHLMSADENFLSKNWTKIKKAVEFIMLQDKNKDGMEDTPMENTLDALWHGEIAWIVGLCIAGVRAGEAMAEEMNDKEFADQCSQYVARGRMNMEQHLFNGEYFIHRADPEVGKKEIGSFNTCHIDQVYGQAWAWQVGLGRIISEEKTVSALNSLWKYNYMPDVGPYISKHNGGRFYAIAGDGGMVMNTNPKNDENPYGNAKAWQIGYFDECMSGFEHQVAAHMMAEGMAEESLILTRSIHDRYHAFKRNPFNEIECSDHYGRAMASYGTFISACGFTYHGPKGHIGFSPKLTPENFRAPFTAAQGWGTYSQQRDGKSLQAQLKVNYGKLKVKKVSVDLDKNLKAVTVEVNYKNKIIPCRFTQDGFRCEIDLNDNLYINANQETLMIKIS